MSQAQTDQRRSADLVRICGSPEQDEDVKAAKGRVQVRDVEGEVEGRRLDVRVHWRLQVEGQKDQYSHLLSQMHYSIPQYQSAVGTRQRTLPTKSLHLLGMVIGLNG